MMYVFIRQLKKQKEEERLALEAKRKAEEEAAKAERERKLEEERQKREQERLRKEEERRQREEERIRKEEDKRRRLKEERERAAEKEKKRKEKEEKEQREREERERLEREKKEALAAKRKAEEDGRRAKEQQEELLRQEKAKADVKADTTKSSSPLPATATTTATPMRPVIDEAARQKTLMDALVGAPASSSSSSSPQPLLNRTSLLSAGIANIPHSMPGDIKPLGMDMPQPPHPLFPPHPFAARDIPPPIGPVRQGEPATSPTRGYAPLGGGGGDRGMLPIGHGRLSSSFDAGRTVAPRPGAQIAPIGQPVNGRRPSTTAGPVGSPMGSRNHWLNSGADDGSNKRSPLATSDAENSFFSNFLFGDHGRGMYIWIVVISQF